MKKFYGLLLFLFASLFLTAQNMEGKIKKLVDSVYHANPEAVGFNVFVESPDQNIHFGYATGYSDRTSKTKLLTGQPVLIASTTKPYVSATILRLVEKGKIDISQPIKKWLSTKTNTTLANAGYDINDITIKHLLSHTSGIRDYVDEGYFKFIGENKKYEWTRDEQISRAASLGKPLSKAGEAFKYADINYILLTEIIENVSHEPFYTAIRKFLKFKELKINNTRFAKLEAVPVKSLPQAHQYWDEFGWDTLELDPSWDLYGGGGIVSTEQDIALFFQYLFNGKIIKNKAILKMMTQDVPPNLEINYCLGIRKIKYSGILGYNHGGGLGTDLIYIPALNASIAVASSEATHRPKAVEISKEIVRLLNLEK
ncbi:serine hydrolase [Chryseobacterium sp. JUb7]|uniref:serine hydrolase domain-containing protein n=1 Tax=Chryseobacterium sp. JUb7 TaxID=2940599 RepID=UPI00216A7034|nr:serine hydrolase domain-containing protein [Chryseobacterium sp. JUb7]MCS3531366.1 D-alanyl-D-alanine carboxypeptidase [Chryseobacterium sp. JUb7]